MTGTRPASSDGRTARTATTRRKILAVTRQLILEGAIDPTAREIADGTGVTVRTLFRHFPDMASLHRSFIEDAEANAAEVMDEPFPDASSTPWQAALEAVIDRRVRVYESLLPLYLSAIWSGHRAANPGSARAPGVIRRRRRLKEVLPAPLANDPILFEAIDAALSIEYWTSLRRDQHLSVARATTVLRTTLAKLTGG